MLCENITGNSSDPISIVFYAAEQTTPPTGTLRIPLDLTEFETEGTYNSDTTEIVEIRNSNANSNTKNADIPVAYVISIGVLAAALITCVVVSITVFTIILRRSKARTSVTATFTQLNRTEPRESDEPIYESITGPLPLVSTISTVTTQDNVAYHHIQRR
jgi:hypothetical protein